MFQTVDSGFHSLGIEPIDLLGFQTDQELENALAPLMQEVEKEESKAA